MVCFNWFAVILYFVIFGLGYSISENPKYSDVTIYTQAVDDWTRGAWTDFEWNDSGTCLTGWESIGQNVWMGTVQGNYTGLGVEPTGEKW